MEQIGRYRIVGELGRGAMGVVFRALDPSIGREVAIKTIRLGDFIDPEKRSQQRERLFREARSAGILSHPSIVTIYDMAEQGEMAYIAMEFVSGETLEQLMSRKESLAPDRIFAILRHTASGLDYAHNKGIVHRDIKPANIILDEAGVAKIADFGIAKISAADQLTQTGLIVGTPNYMAPEQVQGKAVSGMADQYSLAVLSYEILTGDKPFVAEQLTTLVYQIVCEPPPQAQRLNPTLGPHIEEVLQKGLSKLPEQRYATCSELVDALEAACAATPGWKSLVRGGSRDLPTMVDIPEPPSKIAPPSLQNLPEPRVREDPGAKKSRAVPMLVGLVLAGALGGAIYYFGRSILSVPPPPDPPPVQETTQAPAAKPAEIPVEPVPVVAQTPAKEKAAPVEPPAPTSVELPIRSEPSGATATLDKVASTACVTPCVMTARPGAHTITLTLPGFRTIRRPVTATDESMTLPVFTLVQASGVLLVDTDPKGAVIMVDDRRWPDATPARLTLTAGKHRLAVEKGDLKTVQEIEISDGDLKHLTITLNK